MTAAILALGWALYGIGVYRATFRNGFKPEASAKVRWKARAVVACQAAIWPYRIGYSLSKPREWRIY